MSHLWLERVWARSLYLANCNPPILFREEFYSMKKAILKKHGMFDGQVIQRVVKQCWGCAACDPEFVAWPAKCDGDGVFDIRLYLHDGFHLDHYPFLVFLGPFDPRRPYPTTRKINGQIEKEKVAVSKAYLAALVLAIRFDRSYAKSLWNHIRVQHKVWWFNRYWSLRQWFRDKFFDDGIPF